MGAGGFGQVVAAKCRDKKSEFYGAKVALKFQNNCSEKAQKMNLDEVSLLKYCQHPNIVQIHQALDVGMEVCVYFLAFSLFLFSLSLFLSFSHSLSLSLLLSLIAFP